MKGFIFQLVLGTPLLSNLLNITELFVTRKSGAHCCLVADAPGICVTIYRGTRHRYSGTTVAATSGTGDRYSDTAVDIH